MGILSRFGDIMSANVNALLDKAEDPVKMTDQMLRKMNDELAQVKSETAAVMAEETNAKRRVDELQGKVNQYTESAKKALQAGNDEDAKKLLQSKQEFDAQLATANQTYQVAKANSENMQAMYNKLNSDIVTLNSRRENVKAQMSMASAQERANKVADQIGKSNAAANFSRMEEKAQRRLDESTAKMKLAGVGIHKDEASELNAKYSSGSSSSVDAELAAMKAELGL